MRYWYVVVKGGNRSAIDNGGTARIIPPRWDATSLANVAPSGRNSKFLPYPGLRRLPGASPGVMHGTALRAELGRSDDVICSIRADNPGTAAVPGVPGVGQSFSGVGSHSLASL